METVFHLSDINLNLATGSSYISCNKPILYQYWYIIKLPHPQISRSALFKVLLNQPRIIENFDFSFETFRSSFLFMLFVF